MSEVLGRNLTIYVGDGTKKIGCEDSCTFNFENELINVTTKGSGRATNRELGGYDWNVQSSGVIFISPEFDGSETNLDPFEFVSYSLQGKKTIVKFEYSDGTNTKWMYGVGVIGSCVYTGTAEGHATFNVTIFADGPIYTSTKATSRAAFDGPGVYIYTSVGTNTGFDAGLGGVTNHFIVRNGLMYDEIQDLALETDIPVGTGTVGFNVMGVYNFNPSLADGDVVIIVYEPV